MGSVLVVYGSWAGSTAGVAYRIGKTLTACGATVKVVPASSAPDPSGYDAVVVGGAVKDGAWHPVAAAWTAEQASRLWSKPTAFFTVCLTPMVHPERAAEACGYTLPVTAATGVQPVDIGVFAGAYEPNRQSFKTRALMRMWGGKAGDFRDWPAIDAWATDLAGLLGTGDVPSYASA